MQGHADIERFEIVGNPLTGIMLNREASIQATDGTVQDNFVGLNTLYTDIDLEASLVRVNITGNCCGQSCDTISCNIESIEMPIPEAATTSDAFSP